MTSLLCTFKGVENFSKNLGLNQKCSLKDSLLERMEFHS
jgi:hypothetical protein